MGLILLVAFILVPIIEISVIGQVQDAVGWPWTITILVLDSVIGAYVVRTQGARAWRRFQEALGSGRMPTAEIVDGALILFGGALMLTPGFVTDIVGLVAVFPVTRTLINAALRSRITVQSGPVGGPLGGVFSMGRQPGTGSGGRAQPKRPPGFVTDGNASGSGAGDRGVIDVEVVEVVRNDDNP